MKTQQTSRPLFWKLACGLMMLAVLSASLLAPRLPQSAQAATPTQIADGQETHGIRPA